MKHKAPQRDLAFADEPFALVPQSAIDGDRVTAAARQREADQAASERRQFAILPMTPEEWIAKTFPDEPDIEWDLKCTHQFVRQHGRLPKDWEEITEYALS